MVCVITSKYCVYVHSSHLEVRAHTHISSVVEL
uniref:Uncharacterized protein n=1 Tax=Anguilla anguilla TaxID=7936 RepID=A0A0E9S8R2_ANGAN